MSAEEEKTPAKLPSRKSNPIEELPAEETGAEAVQNKLTPIHEDKFVVLQLAQLRHKAGLTQEDMARALRVSQSAISKLESGTDDELTIGEVKGYAKATGQRIGLSFGEPRRPLEAVKWHALGLKSQLEAMAEAAHRSHELRPRIQAFFGEAFFNLLDVLAGCSDRVPRRGDVEVQIEALHCLPPSAKAKSFSPKDGLS